MKQGVSFLFRGHTRITHDVFPVFLQIHPVVLESDKAKSFQQPGCSLGSQDQCHEASLGIKEIVLNILEFWTGMDFRSCDPVF